MEPEALNGTSGDGADQEEETESPEEAAQVTNNISKLVYTLKRPSDSHGTSPDMNDVYLCLGLGGSPPTPSSIERGTRRTTMSKGNCPLMLG